MTDPAETRSDILPHPRPPKPPRPSASTEREAERLREALERILPLVVDLSERGWIKGAEATRIIREALNG